MASCFFFKFFDAFVVVCFLATLGGIWNNFRSLKMELNSHDNDDAANDNDAETYFVPPSQRADAPLAGIIPPELDDIDPK
jgi:hypothetical protein